MKILLTNDDGINSTGLKELVKCLKNFGNLIVVAPDQERSGSGCSSSIYQTIRCRKIGSEQDFPKYSLSGTPVDCVMVALEKLCENDKPDLIISGINAGANLGRDVFYSGTVGAAIEGAFHGILSIAISIDQKERPIYYSSAVKVMNMIMNRLPLESNHHSRILNINIPNVAYSKIKGIRLTKLAYVHHQKFIKSIFKSDHSEYFWIEGSQPMGMMEDNSDYWAVQNNYVSLTEVSLELKHPGTQSKLKPWIKQLNHDRFFNRAY